MDSKNERHVVSDSSDLNELIQIGIALSSEKDINRLLQKIATAARRVSRAEGVTVYICNDQKSELKFTVVQNEKLDLNYSHGESIDIWPNVALYNQDGSENHSNASAHCALTNKPVNIQDVYCEKGFDFKGTREFDKRLDYKSKSMLLIPMCDHEDEIIGVLQLLNCQSGAGLISFPGPLVEIVSGLASQAAIAITNVRLVTQTEDLLKSFVKAIACAIDEKSSYTAGHIARVVQLTEDLAKAVSNSTLPRFSDINFTEDNLEEVRLAAWLHDIGKISTPQYIIDKATKLETVVDRIELIKLRLEILKRDVEGDKVRHQTSEDINEKQVATPGHNPKDRQQALEAVDEFLLEINRGREFLHDDDARRVREIAEVCVNIQGQDMPLISEDELQCFIIEKGTLTEHERSIINRHVVITNEMLTKLPFPKKWQRVPEYAGAHHEKLNGTGYPFGLKDRAIALPARILAIADIFEALTAPDRPYKTGLKLSRAIQILEYMVEENQLDKDICDLLMETGVALSYARTHLPIKQLDSYIWCGKKYDVFS